MAYKDKKERINASLILTEEQKLKLDFLKNKTYSSFNLTTTKLINKIMVDYLDTVIIDQD